MLFTIRKRAVQKASFDSRRRVDLNIVWLYYRQYKSSTRKSRITENSCVKNWNWDFHIITRKMMAFTLGCVVHDWRFSHTYDALYYKVHRSRQGKNISHFVWKIIGPRWKSSGKMAHARILAQYIVLAVSGTRTFCLDTPDMCRLSVACSLSVISQLKYELVKRKQWDGLG